MSEDLTQEMLKQKKWAVLGVSRQKEKYGYKVFRKLLDLGYTVYPVNPGAKEVDSVKCFPDLDALPEVPDVVNCVVPPPVTEKAVEKCIELGVKYIWMQPGAANPRAVQLAENAGIKTVHDVCVLLRG